MKDLINAIFNRIINIFQYNNYIILEFLVFLSIVLLLLQSAF